MKIDFSDHALAQLQERKLSRSEVRAAVSRPDRVTHQRDHRFRALKRLTTQGKLYVLVVVYEQEADGITIVTAFRTSKLEKYR